MAELKEYCPYLFFYNGERVYIGQYVFLVNKTGVSSFIATYENNTLFNYIFKNKDEAEAFYKQKFVKAEGFIVENVFFKGSFIELRTSFEKENSSDEWFVYLQKRVENYTIIN